MNIVVFDCIEDESYTMCVNHYNIVYYVMFPPVGAKSVSLFKSLVLMHTAISLMPANGIALYMTMPVVAGIELLNTRDECKGHLSYNKIKYIP